MLTQAAVKARAGGLRVQELAHHRQQIIQRDQKRLAEGHRDSFLRWRQRRLKAMGRVAAILHAGTLAPFPYGLFRGPVTLGKNPRRVVTGLYGRPDLRWRRRLTVKLDHHVALPSRASVKTQRAMKNAERRGLSDQPGWNTYHALARGTANAATPSNAISTRRPNTTKLMKMICSQLRSTGNRNSGLRHHREQTGATQLIDAAS